MVLVCQLPEDQLPAEGFGSPPNQIQKDHRHNFLTHLVVQNLSKVSQSREERGTTEQMAHDRANHCIYNYTLISHEQRDTA